MTYRTLSIHKHTSKASPTYQLLSLPASLALSLLYNPSPTPADLAIIILVLTI